ncbi:MAG: hypothetical protein ABFS56_35760 [Pseudomonadota bacterium]
MLSLTIYKGLSVFQTMPVLMICGECTILVGGTADADIDAVEAWDIFTDFGGFIILALLRRFHTAFAFGQILPNAVVKTLGWYLSCFPARDL